MIHSDSTKFFFRLFLSLSVLFLHCESDSTESLAPIVPTTDLNYDLKIGDKVVGKVQGSVEFTVFYPTTDNSTKSATFGLLSKDITVNGSQTGEKTIFNIYAKDAKRQNDVEWTLTFVKSSKGDVKLSESSLHYDTKGWPKSKSENITVHWTNAVQLASSSSDAYKCSFVAMSNEHDRFAIKDAIIQPFDVKDGKFGKETVCSQDQPLPPQAGNWTVTQVSSTGKDTYTCIIFKGFVYLSIGYATDNDTNATATVLVPYNATTEGSTCNYDFNKTYVVGTEQILQLNFPIGTSSKIWKLILKFTNDSVLTGNSKNVDVYQAELDFVYDPSLFSDIGDKRLLNTASTQTNSVNMTSGEGALSMFIAASDHSYRCNSNETTNVTGIFWIKTNSLVVEAYLQNSTNPLTEHVCTADQNQETSDLIPIIIGAALAALVVVVLVAYLIGRARAKGSNYETI